VLRCFRDPRTPGSSAFNGSKTEQESRERTATRCHRYRACGQCRVYTCVVKDQWGDSAVSTPAVLTLMLIEPQTQLSVTGVRNIVSAQACSLSLSTTDADAGRRLSMQCQAPQGATLTAISSSGHRGRILAQTRGLLGYGQRQASHVRYADGLHHREFADYRSGKSLSIKVVSKVNEYFVLSWTKLAMRIRTTCSAPRIPSISRNSAAHQIRCMAFDENGQLLLLCRAVTPQDRLRICHSLFRPISIPPVIMVLPTPRCRKAKPSAS